MVAGLWTPDQSWINLDSFLRKFGNGVRHLHAIAGAPLTRGDLSPCRNSAHQLTLSPTPLPQAALPLFASALGLGGFLGYRRKRKAAMTE